MNIDGRAPDEFAAALVAAGRPHEALRAIEGPAAAPEATHSILAAYGGVLKALGRMEECLAARRLAAERFPESAIAVPNTSLASGLDALAYTACATGEPPRSNTS